MRALAFLISLAVIAPLQFVIAKGNAYVDDRLPPASIELKPGASPATSMPWQLPKPGDPLYDAKKEADIKNNPGSHWAHAFERGVFKGYVTVTIPPPRGRQGAFVGRPVKFDKGQLVGGNFPGEYRPPYPVEARRQGQTGSGVYILHIDSKTGDVTSVAIQRSTGHKLLDDAVLSACVHWRFKPHTVTDVWFPVTFSISGRL